MTQHLCTPPRPWAGLETHHYAASDQRLPDTDQIARRRSLAALALALGYLTRKRASGSADAG